MKITRFGGSFIGWSEKAIGILIFWKWGGNHDAPNLTDSIILASIHPKYHTVSMLSVPRDLYVEYGNNQKWKINEIYRKYFELEKLSETESAMKLAEKLQEITWFKADYFVGIDFEWFKKIIDLVGGVEVEVEKAIYDNEYPTPSWGYTTFILKAGTWNIDGETALKYARSRHSTSDFDRSFRQQQIISWLKEKLSSEGYLSSPRKMKELYNILSNYIKTNLDIATIIDLAKESQQNISILSANLNNSCFYWSASCEKWGFLYTPDRNLFWGASVLVPNGSTWKNLSNYAEIQVFTRLFLNSPEIFKNNYQINIFNASKKYNIASELANILVKHWFNVPLKWSIWNTKGKEFLKTTLYYNWIDGDDETLQNIRQMLGISELQKTETPLYSTDINTKIEIILGDDYETLSGSLIY